MKIISAARKIELLSEINNLNTKDSEVYLSLRPTMEIIHRTLENAPNLKKISCPPSLYLQVSKKVFQHLHSKEIQLMPGEFTVGRPMKHDEEMIKQILQDRANGKTAKSISEEYKVPVRTVYFYLKNGLQQ